MALQLLQSQLTMNTLIDHMCNSSDIVPVTDDFIDVHVALCARASLPYNQRKMVVQLSLVHLSRRGNDGICQASVEAKVVSVDLSTCPLEVAKGMDHWQLHTTQQNSG